MSLETTHNDHTISYNENNDVWQCRELDLSAKTLSTLKTKINDFDAKERKLGKNGVALLYLGDWKNTDGVKVRATMLNKAMEDGSNHAAVWISYIDSKTREKTGIHALVLDTPENHAVLAEAKNLEADAALLSKKAAAMRQNIKRLTVEELKAMALEVKPE